MRRQGRCSPIWPWEWRVFLFLLQARWALWGRPAGTIVGFVAAAWLTSVCRGGAVAGFGRLLAAGTVGVVVVFALGVAWQTLWFGGNVGLALKTGFVPFAYKATVELLLAVAVTLKWRGWRRRLTKGDRV